LNGIREDFEMAKSEYEKQLTSALSSWRESLLRVGQILNKAQASGEPVDLWRKVICCQQFSMPMATSGVAMRWAAGEYGEGDSAQMVVARIPHSKLQKMPSSVARDLATKPQKIVSPSENRVVTKTLKQMDAEEIKFCIRDIGVPPVDEQVQKQPRVFGCVARAVEHDESTNSVVFIGTGNNPIRMRVTRRLLDDAVEKLAAEVY